MPSSTARRLRSNPTDAEQRLWNFLRRRQVDGFRLRRQAPIGRYIVDFVCFSKKLVIEVDGGQHATDTERDAVRTLWLEGQGFRVLRFWNNDVLANTEGVVEAIHRELLDSPPP